MHLSWIISGAIIGTLIVPVGIGVVFAIWMLMETSAWYKFWRWELAPYVVGMIVCAIVGAVIGGIHK